MRFTKIAFLFLVFSVFFVRVASAETLNIVTALDPVEASDYFAMFEKESGIKIQWIRLSAGETLARLKSEVKNQRQDIWFGSPAPELYAARLAGLLEPYSSAATREIPEKWRDKENYWTGIYFGAISFISGKGVTPPQSWQDLLKPEYKGEIVVSYPYTAGTGYIVLAGLASIMGEEDALDYYKKLDGQLRRYTKTGSSPVMEVGLGEANVGIIFIQDALRKGKARGFPIEVTIPNDGVPYEIGGVAIIAGRASEAAKRFVDFAVSLEAQNNMQKWYRVPLNPKATIREGLYPPDKLKLAPMTIEWAGAKREELIKKWREKVGK